MSENNDKINFCEREEAKRFVLDIMRELRADKKLKKSGFHYFSKKFLELDKNIQNNKDLYMQGLRQIKDKFEQIDKHTNTERDFNKQYFELINKKIENMQNSSDESFLELKKEMDDCGNKILKRINCIIAIISAASISVITLVAIYIMLIYR